MPNPAASAGERADRPSRRREYALLAAAACAVAAFAAAGFVVGHKARQKVVPVSVSASATSTAAPSRLPFPRRGVP